MNKMAVFVEGLTEQIFIEKLLIEIAGRKDIHIEKCELTGGKKCPRKKINLQNKATGKKYFAYIINCRGDSTVKSDIVDNYDSLVSSGYNSIVGIRDVFPVKRPEIPKLQRHIYFRVKIKPVAPVIILSVMEIEAWFLAEHSHFPKIHRALTAERIGQVFGFDPSRDDMQLRDQPSLDLHNIYALEGKAYRKKEWQALRTTKALDYANIYLDLCSKINPLNELTSEINRFMNN